jgi:hypothetical protein
MGGGISTLILREKKQVTFAVSLVLFFCELIQRPCHYCGDSVSDVIRGIGREDNSLGFEVGNMATSCPTRNYIKGKLTRKTAV